MAIEYIEILDKDGVARKVAADSDGTELVQLQKIALGADGAVDLVLDSGAQAAAASMPVVGATDQVGVGTDAPYDGAEDATARTIISLLKGSKNYLRDLKGFVDGVEALLTSMGGYTDGLEALVGTTNSSLTTLAGYLDGVEAALAAATPAGTNIIGKVGIDQTTPGTTNGVQVNAALPAGTNAIGKLAANSGVDIGDVDVTSVTPGTAAGSLGKAEDAAHSSGDTGVMLLAVRNDTPAALAGASGDYIPLTTDKLGALLTTPRAATPYKNIDVDESEDAVSANPCRIMGFVAYNLAAAGTKRYLKFYNDTVGNVVVGTTTPVFVLPLDGTQGGVFSIPLLFSVACTIAATTGVADNDTGAPGANEVVFSCGYLDL